MINTRAVLLTSLFVTATTLPLGVLTKGSLDARDTAQAATLELSTIRTQAGEILSLRATRAQFETAERAPQDVIAQANLVLAECGLPTDRLGGLERESSSAVREGGVSALRKQSVLLTLRAMTPKELGSFLARWREVASPWTVSRIDLQRSRDGGSDPNRFQVRMVLAAAYRADGFEGARR